MPWRKIYKKVYTTYLGYDLEPCYTTNVYDSLDEAMSDIKRWHEKDENRRKSKEHGSLLVACSNGIEQVDCD